MQLLKLDHWGLGAGAHARRCRSCSYSRLAIRGTIRTEVESELHCTSCTFKSWWTDGMIIEKHRAQNYSWSVNSVIKLSVCYFTAPWSPDATLGSSEILLKTNSSRILLQHAIVFTHFLSDTKLFECTVKLFALYAGAPYIPCCELH